MNILELDSFNLADAVKFNDKLNPRIWQGQQMRPEVREKLLEIAADFKESLGLGDLEVKDITVSGSNAAYTYTPYSDIDLHLVVDVPRLASDEVYRELFDAKKYQYNEMHNIKIGGYDVELYVEDANKPPVSQGVFSVLNNDWLHIPRQRKATVDDDAVRSKYEDIKHRINDAVDSNDADRLNALAKKIKAYRQAGLDKHGELGSENLAYKMLRNQGYIKKLYDARTAARDAELSLAEQNKVKKPFVYGHRNMEEDVTTTPDGVSPSTKMFLSEQDPPSDEDILKDFIDFVSKELKLKELPVIKLRKDPQWSVVHKTFGRYMDDRNMLEVAWGQRHIMDVLRTVAHELTHRRQHEREDVPLSAGETGSPYENEANARAGVLMRDYARLHPEYFEAGQAQGLHADEIAEASGYIPTKAQAKDPRFKMALTVDVHPGQTGKEANKMALKTDKQGKPALLIKSANLLKEFQEFKAGLTEDQDLLEVKMTGKNLAKLAKDIKGVKVGLEFEMIVPNTDDPEERDMEPDYDQDERVRDIDDCVNFFDDGDYNGRTEIRRLRDQMYEDYYIWRSEQIDNDWYNGGDGFEYFKDYLDREDPFDEEEAEEEARNQLQAEYGDELDTEEFEKMLFALVEEKRESYAQDQWDEQGRNFDDAKEEFEEEQRDNYSEQDWLESQGIRYASDVEGNYGNVTWPYYTSASNEGEADIENVALDFMNAMGMDSVAISTSYHGSYKKWVGNGWVSIGSNKPDDCFTIEPDGSLAGDSDTDAGLEFVSPPIPLEDIGTVMKKVQNWAGTYGAYTGKNNKTSIHTNISVPGYDLDKLDYLKAALLLGDEYVLREFDRIGNTYAAPAIEKVKALVKQKPEKAKELLDKMKSQLNAEASKLIHSGQTNKFTSINTKDNRVEFRSPGGDYLSIIADNPQKMVDTINRMVVTLDAAMDPNKYKEEYQKKLYKVLTGQAGGREAATGKKQEMKKDDKDLLNIFSRYAAGELPKAALKSFVRQAQLQRKIERDPNKGQGKWWWNVAVDGQRVEVVAADNVEAWEKALQTNPEWRRFSQGQADITPLRPYDEKPAQQSVGSLYKIYNTNGQLIAGDEYGSDRAALARAGVWAMRRGVDVVVKNAQGEEIGRVSASGEITPTAQQSTADHNWCIRRRDSQEIVKTFQADDYNQAFEVLQQYKQDHNITDNSLTYGHYNPSEEQPTPIPGSTLDLQRQQAAQQSAGTRNFQLYNITTDEIIDTFPARNYDEAMTRLRDYRQHGEGQSNPGNFSIRPEPDVNSPTAINTPPAGGTSSGNWGIWIDANNRFANQPGEYARGAEVPLIRFPTRDAAEQWIEQQRASRPNMRTDIEVREIPPRLLPGSTLDLQRQRAAAARDTSQFGAATGAPNWELQRDSDREIVQRFSAPDQDTAIGQASDWIAANQLDPNAYTLQAIDAARGGLIDVATDQPAQAPRTLTTPGQGQQVFTGQWQVVDNNGQELYRFSGVGNSQGDANRVAQQWVNAQRAQGNVIDAREVDVLPVMGEA